MHGFDHDRATRTLGWLKARKPEAPGHRWERAQYDYKTAGLGSAEDFEEDMNCLMDRGQLYEPILGILKVV